MGKLSERKQKIFYRKTKKGNIIKIVREHYLRDDVYCGLESCEVCEGNKCLKQLTSSGSNLFTKPHHLIIDTNVALHQIDVLCQDAITNVIVPQTVLQEVKHRSLPVYKRLRDLIESSFKHFYVFTNEHHLDCYIEREENETANDRNDRAIRIACWWYQQHFAFAEQNVILLTDDAENLTKAKDLELDAYTTREYIASLTEHPGLLDIVAQKGDESMELTDDNRFVHTPHWSMDDVRAGIKKKKLCQGVLKTSRNNYLEANVIVGDDKSVLIQGRINLNRALHDDIVALEIFPEDEWSSPSTVILDQEKQEDDQEPEESDKKSVIQEQAMLAAGKSEGNVKMTGKIVGIIRRKWRQYCGILRRNEILESSRHMFIPADKKIPFIKIETRQADLLHSKRILVAIDSWPRDSKNPKGHFVRVIGQIGDKETENEVILLEHDCPHSKFSESVLNCLPKLPWIITPEDEAVREDLRHLDVCSVDPVGCQDIDDALHCRELNNGNMEVGVHIADVSHFIRPNTNLDKEAQSRSTTVYLTTRRIDMVPELLSTNLCSLRSKQDRFAFSVLWEINKKGTVLSSRFCKSIIHSRDDLTYEQAQQRIEDSSFRDNVTISLRNLNKLAKQMKRKRQNDGALVLASMEVKFHIDPDTDTVVDIVAKQQLETMSMVEEFMLLANVTAAATTLKNFPDSALLRRHPAPPISNFEPLLAAAKSQGIEIDVTSNKTLSKSLDNAIRESNPFFNSMLRIMTTRCMMQALYFCSSTQEKPEFYHYGLATPFYTHFTSPIRRYADIIVHRLLAVTIERDQTYPELLDPKKCADLAQHINYRHKMAQYASRASSEVTANTSLRGKVNEYDSYILFLHKNAIQVLIPTIGQQCTLFLDVHIRELQKKKREYEKMKRMGETVDEPMEDDSSLPQFTFNEKELWVRCENIEFRPFDQLTIQLSVDSSDIQHEKVITRLVKPFIAGFSVPSVKDDVAPPQSKKMKIKC